MTLPSENLLFLGVIANPPFLLSQESRGVKQSNNPIGQMRLLRCIIHASQRQNPIDERQL